MIETLTLDQLRILVTVADTGSFSAAGRTLGRVQSAISQSVAALEVSQGVEIFDRTAYRPRLTEAGRVLIDQARLVLAGAARFQAVAANVRGGLEAELRIAIDPLVPSAPFTESLRTLGTTYPDLSISFSTEGLGSSLRRLRDGSASLGICTLLPNVPDDIAAAPLLRTVMRPVVAAGHPLATLRRPVTESDLEPHVQLVLSDSVEPEGPNYGLVNARLWRFADLNRRLDFLLAGLGWCRMPDHMIADAVATGRLVELEIENDTAPSDGLIVYTAHRRDHVPGPAARYLLNTVRQRLDPDFQA